MRPHDHELPTWDREAGIRVLGGAAPPGDEEAVDIRDTLADKEMVMKLRKRTLVISGAAILLGAATGLLTRPTASPNATARQSRTANEIGRTSSSGTRGFGKTPGPAPRRAAIPNIESGSPPKRLVTSDPGARDYDAAEAAQALGLSVRALFDSEPRNDLWAPAMEAALTDQIGRDLEAAGLDMAARSECRQMTCRITLDATDKEQLKRGQVLLQYVPLGMVFEPGETRGNGRNFYLALTKDEHGVDAWRQEYRVTRASWLAKRKAEASSYPEWFPPIPSE